MGRFRVLLVDDHPVVRIGLCASLQGLPDVEVCGEAAAAPEALAAAKRLQPDAVVVDLDLAGRDARGLIESLAALRPSPRILVYSALDGRLHVRRAARAGAHGYLMKGASPERLVAALRTVLEGRLAFDEALLREAVRSSDELPVESLTERELEVFRQLGQGRRGRAAAEALRMSARTFNSYRERIKSKLALPDGSALDMAAYEFVRANAPRG